MTPRERVLNAMRRRVPDRLPWEVKLTPPVREALAGRIGTADVEEYFSLPAREVHFRPRNEAEPFRRYYVNREFPPLPNPSGWEIGDWGVGQTAGGFEHFVRLSHPLAGAADPGILRDYPFPDMAETPRHAHLPEDVRSLHDRGLAAVGYMEWTIFEMAWYMRGMDELLADFVLNPVFAGELLDRITDARCVQARIMAESGVDLVKLGDDVGSQRALLMSPAMWREWLKPRLARVVAAAKTARPDVLVFYHSDGNIAEIVPDLVEIGVDILNPIQPECMDLARLKREYGGVLSFWGGLGTQTTMPFGSPRDVREEARRLARVMGAGGGYLLAPTHLLEPEVPLENILSLREAMDEL